MAKPDSADSLLRGQHLASLLAGAWGSSPPAIGLSPETITRLIPQVVQLGAAGLAWWKVRHSGREGEEALATLEQAAQVCRLESFVCACELADVIDVLRYQGMDPLVSQGWVAARLYPEASLRPQWDVALHVDPSRFEEAKQILTLPLIRQEAGFIRLWCCPGPAGSDPRRTVPAFATQCITRRDSPIAGHRGPFAAPLSCLCRRGRLQSFEAL